MELSEVNRSMQEMLDWVRQTEEALSSQQPISEQSNELDAQVTAQKVSIFLIYSLLLVFL